MAGADFPYFIFSMKIKMLHFNENGFQSVSDMKNGLIFAVSLSLRHKDKTINP